jgi:hypothetical protein
MPHRTYNQRFASCTSFKRADSLYHDWDNEDEEETWKAKLNEPAAGITPREAIDTVFKFVDSSQKALEVQRWECLRWDYNQERYYYVLEKVVPFLTTVQEVWELLHGFVSGHDYTDNDIEVRLLAQRLLEIEGYTVIRPQTEQAT